MRPHFFMRSVLGAERAACRRLISLICAGWVPHDNRFVGELPRSSRVTLLPGTICEDSWLALRVRDQFWHDLHLAFGRTLDEHHLAVIDSKLFGGDSSLPAFQDAHASKACSGGVCP